MKKVFLSSYEGNVVVTCGWTTSRKKIIEAAREKLQKVNGKAITNLSNITLKDHLDAIEESQKIGINIDFLYPYKTEI